MSPNKRKLRGAAVGAALILAATTTGCGVTNAVSSGGGNADGPFYDGKEITLIVPFDAGGASDTFSRVFAKYLTKYIDGKPKVIVENVPGGGQKEGLNRFAQAPDDDGLTLAMGSGGIIASTLFDPEGIRFDIADFETLAAFGGGMTIFANTADGIESVQDLETSKSPVFYGGLEFTASEAVRVFALDQLGIDDLRPLMGYDGGGSITTAVMRGELTAGNSTTSHYINNVRPLEEDGDIVPLMSQGYVADGTVIRDPATPDLPTMPEAYEKLTGKKAEGTGWSTYTAITTAQTNLLRNYWVPKEAPADAKNALHDAVGKVVEDEDFLDEATALLGEKPPVLLGDEADASLDAARNLTDEQKAWVEDYIAEMSAR